MGKKTMPKRLYVIEHETDGYSHVAHRRVDEVLACDVDKVMRVGVYQLVREEDLMLERQTKYVVVKAKGGA